MSHYSLEFPYIFLLIPIFWFCFKKCPPKNFAIYMPYINVLFKDKKLKSRWLDILKWLAIILLLIAIASPVKVEKFRAYNTSSRDIMLVIDSSKSMLEKGFDSNNPNKNKFQVVKEVVSDFIKKRENDRIGLINFASAAFIASPLTFDKKYLSDILKKQQVGIVGKRTAIYDALVQAIYVLNNTNSKNKIAILLTDGIDNMSETPFNTLLDFIKRSNIRIYTIGIGNFKDLDVNKLEAIAKAGNGKFYIATNSNTLKNIYTEIDKLETSKGKGRTYYKFTYYYYFPLIFAIIFLTMFVYAKSVRGIAK